MRLAAARLDPPVLLVHGGAGSYDRARDAATLAALADGLHAALAAGWVALQAGDALAAVVEAVAALEEHGGFNAGRGGVPTTDGTVQLDAGVMDGTGRAGAVACLTGRSAVRAARAVHDLGGPVLLAGACADRCAAAAGVPALLPAAAGPAASEHGTVGAVAVTADGRLAAATSTGGIAGQLPGRVGDSPIPGAGVWAAADGAAVSATGVGEALLLAGFARLVSDRHQEGLALPTALQAALARTARFGGHGGGIALDAQGRLATGYDTRAMSRGIRHHAGAAVTVLEPALRWTVAQPAI